MPRRSTALNARRLAAAALLATLLALLTPALASAHAEVTRSDPAIGGTYADPPDAITLWFSEPVEARYTRIAVVNSAGKPVKTGAVTAVADSSTPALRVALSDKLGDDSYTVVWSSVSAVDGHVANGFFSFAIGSASLPSDTAQAALVRQATAERSAPPAIEAGARWLGLLGQATLAGALVCLLVVLLPATRGAPMPARRVRRLLGGALAAVVVAQLAAALLQTMDANRAGLGDALGRPLYTLLTETRFGAIWLARGTLIVALALLVWTLTRRPRLVAPRGRGRLVWGAALLTSALLLLTTSLNSHAAALGGGVSLNTLNDWLHLLGTSVWLGGLVALVTLTPLYAGATGKVVARFSALALGAVALLVVTGVIAARWQVLSLHGLTSTRYGAWLLVKLTLVVGTLGFGAWHLLVAKPGLAAGDAAAGRAFRRTLRAEATLAVLVLVATAALTISIPARDLLQGGTRVFATTRLTPDASVTLRASPGKVGLNQFSVVVAPIDLASFGAVQRVYLRFEPVNATVAGGGASQRILLGDAGPDDPNTWVGSGDYLALKGDWVVTVIIRRDGVKDLETPFNLTATSSGLQPTGIAPLAARGRSTSATLLGLAWFALAVGLLVGGWLLRRERASLAYGLFALAVASLTLGSYLLAVSSAAAR